MILIDAIYINNGGGKVLLDYLIEELEKSDLKVFYLLDKRIFNNHPKIESNGFLYMDSSFIKRYNYYKNNKEKFEKVFCFGNVPPPIKPKSKVYTYFHQPLFIEIPKDLSLINKFVINLKTLVIKKFINNTDYFLVQSLLIKDRFSKKFNVNGNQILEMPFYSPLVGANLGKKEKNTYIYVSNASTHKNHIRLINAFCSFYDLYNKGVLILTVSNEYKNIIDLIEIKTKNKYPIINLGFINRKLLLDFFSKTEYHIFPSLAESFGLGLVESIENDCKIIGADLPYTYEVCSPSLVFNPYNIDSIKDALIETLTNSNIKVSQIKINNNIDKIIELLQN